MTIASTSIRSDYTGPGSVFTFNFPTYGQSTLKLIVTDALGNQTVLASNQYTLVGIKTTTDYSEGGTITYTLASGSKLAIVSNVNGTQQTSIKNNSEYYAVLHENEFDRLSLGTLQLMEQSKKTLRGPDAEPASGDSLILPVASLRANMYLTFDNNGNVQLINAVKSSITDWTSYTPTIPWDNCTASGMWRRVGDTMEVKARVILTGTPVSTDELNITLPGSYTIDATKSLLSSGDWTQTHIVGTGGIKKCVSSVYSYRALFATLIQTLGNVITNNAVKIMVEDTNGNTFNIKPALPDTLQTTTTLTINFSIPISGWTYYA
jgi:hypothetical protein